MSKSKGMTLRGRSEEDRSYLVNDDIWMGVSLRGGLWGAGVGG